MRHTHTNHSNVFNVVTARLNIRTTFTYGIFNAVMGANFFFAFYASIFFIFKIELKIIQIDIPTRNPRKSGKTIHMETNQSFIITRNLKTVIMVERLPSHHLLAL